MNERNIVRTLSAVAVCGLLASCGGSGESGGTASSGKPAEAVADAPMAQELAAAGFQAVFSRSFPAQVPGKKANAVAYQDKSGKGVGGIIYTLGYEAAAQSVVWHWYFDDGAPDSLQAVELNDDGLWDVIVYMRGGTTREFIQDTDFTFVAPERNDRIAMNGGASSTEGLWRVFDGDSTTAWGGANASVTIPTPLGLEDGTLVIQLTKDKRPGKCEVKVDGKKVDEFDLAATNEAQSFSLDATVKTADAVELRFSGDGDVLVSEVGIR